MNLAMFEGDVERIPLKGSDISVECCAVTGEKEIALSRHLDLSTDKERKFLQYTESLNVVIDLTVKSILRNGVAVDIKGKNPSAVLTTKAKQFIVGALISGEVSEDDVKNS